MMMEYEWGNPAATAAAMMLFADNSSADTGQDATVFDHYSGHGLGNIGGIGCFFPHSQPMAATVPLFSPASSTSSSSCHQRYGLAFPPQDPARIGLNLGVRTYFSSRSPDDELPMAPRVFRRRTRIARCQADGCGADLTNAKHYHRRHKVCEFHSKSSIVITAGLSQRFCQQCSRFHVLSEFDQGKRSCRKRLADHNRRRRKSQDLSTASINSQANTTTTGSNDADKTNTNSTTSITATKSGVKQGNVLFSSNTSDDNSNNNNNNNIESSVNLVSSPVVQAPPQMGLGCGMSPASFALLPQLADFRVGAEQRFSSWVDEEEEEEDYNIGGIYQNKEINY